MEADTIHDEVFGELYYDPPMEEWCGEVAFAGGTLEVAIWWHEPTHGTFAPVLPRAREAFRLFVQQQATHLELLAQAMIDRYRQSARPHERLPSVTQLASGLRAERIAFTPSGHATVHYADATELFYDHDIMLDLNADGSFDGFSLQG